MMLAPKKGSELRGDIVGSLEDLQDRVTDLIDEGREKLSQLTGFGGDDSLDTTALAEKWPSKQAVS